MARLPGRRAGAGAFFAAVALAAAGLGPPPAVARDAYLPKPGKLFHGLTDSGQFSDTLEFQRGTGSHPAVVNYYVTWGDPIDEALHHWSKGRSRGMLTLTTSRGHGQPGLISPRQVSRGRGDRWLLGLGAELRRWGDPVYVSPFPEMNGHWNAYAPYSADGSRRPGNGPRRLRDAYRRIALILRGGPTRRVNRKLRDLGMPPARARRSVYGRLPRRLARAPVALAWIPQSHGSPRLAGNGPGAFWPGRRYVDWVGADTFSRFSNFEGLGSIYRKFARRMDKPMMIGEYAPWGSDDSAWVRRLHRWARDRRRVRMLVYYQGFGERGNPFRLDRYPRAQRALRRILGRRAYQSYARGRHTGRPRR